MKIIFNLYFLLVVSCQIFAQKPYINWQKCLGGSNDEWPQSVIITHDGNFIIAGNTWSDDGDISCNHGYSDAWIVKVDLSGQVLWQKCFGGSMEDYVLSIVETKDGGLLLSGGTRSNDGDITGNNGNFDAWIIKLDQSGKMIWNRCFGGANDDQAYSVIETESGDFVASGYTKSNDGDVSGLHDNSDVWIIKLDQSGNILWNKCFGGSNDDQANSVVEIKNGGLVGLCSTYSNDGDVSGNHGGKDWWIIKLDLSGQMLWQKCLGGSYNDIPSSIIKSNEGDFLITGYTESNDGDVSGNHGSIDAWIINLDNSGHIIRQKCFGGNKDDYASAIVETSGSGFLIACYTYSNDGDVSGVQGRSDASVVKLDYSGQILWQKCFGGSGNEYVHALIPVNNAEYILACATNSNNGDVHGNHSIMDCFDIWIVKLGMQTSVLEEENDDNISIVAGLNSDNIIIKTQLPVTDDMLSIYNIYGQTVYSGKLEHEITVDISSFAPGAYFVSAGNRRSRFIKY